MYGDGDEDVYGGEERRQIRAETVSCSSTAELPSEHSSRSTRSPFVFYPVPASHQPTNYRLKQPDSSKTSSVWPPLTRCIQLRVYVHTYLEHV